MKKTNQQKKAKIICFHENCSHCGGTGKKRDGTVCIHYVVCNCSKCSSKKKFRDYNYNQEILDGYFDC